DERWDLRERVQLRRGGVGEEQHVRLVDGLEPADGGTVEADAVREEVLGQLIDGDREVLPQTREVHEPEVHDLGALLLCEMNDVPRLHPALLSCARGRPRRPLVPMGGLEGKRHAWRGTGAKLVLSLLFLEDYVA